MTDDVGISACMEALEKARRCRHAWTAREISEALTEGASSSGPSVPCSFTTWAVNLDAILFLVYDADPLTMTPFIDSDTS